MCPAAQSCRHFLYPSVGADASVRPPITQALLATHSVGRGALTPPTGLASHSRQGTRALPYKNAL